ncbi:MAG: Zn-dependent oligopeptidase, partial [Myxococcota bacterium]
TTTQAAEMDRTLQEAVDGVMDACASPGRASVCAPVMEALVEIPETLDDGEAVTAHTARVVATRGSNNEVNAAIDTFTTTLGSALALHTRIRDIQQQADDAHSRMEEASAEQARIVEAVNTDCQG